MLKKYIDIQQRKLDDLAQQRIELHAKLSREQDLISQLQDYSQNLTDGIGTAQVFNMQNQQLMKTHIHDLISSQRQQVVLTEADLSRQNRLIKQQIGQLKGVESVAKRRQDKAELALELQTQFNNDELATQAFLRNRSF